MRYRINKKTIATVQPASEEMTAQYAFNHVVVLETEPSETRLGRGQNATIRSMPGSSAVVAAFEQEVDASLYIIRILKGKQETE